MTKLEPKTELIEKEPKAYRTVLIGVLARALVADMESKMLSAANDVEIGLVDSSDGDAND